MYKKMLLTAVLAGTFALQSFLSPSSVFAAPAESMAIQSEKHVGYDLNNSSVIQAGMKYLGKPYEFGSDRSNTETFDCSDFVRQVFLEGKGITLPSNSRTQAEYIKKNGLVNTDWKKLKPGDIMFFMSYRGSKESDYNGINKTTERITHNGIYLGDGKILHTYSKASGGVRIDTIEGKHWESRFLFGGTVVQ